MTAMSKRGVAEPTVLHVSRLCARATFCASETC